MSDQPDYIEEYDQFTANFKQTEVSAAEVGEFVMRMTGFFIRYNVRLGTAIRDYAAVKSDFQNQTDVSGKPMSSAKAETLASNTQAAHGYEMARIHVQNLEQIINSLKALQKGVLTEYSHGT